MIGSIFHPREFLVEFSPLTSPEDSNSISWREDKLILREGLSITNQEEFTPDEESWTFFWQNLENIGFWDWDLEYNLCSMEGTRWQVIIEYDDREIHTTGLNHYPDNFPLFIKAVEELTGRELHFPP